MSHTSMGCLSSNNFSVSYLVFFFATRQLSVEAVVLVPHMQSVPPQSQVV